MNSLNRFAVVYEKSSEKIVCLNAFMNKETAEEFMKMKSQEEKYKNLKLKVVNWITL